MHSIQGVSYDLEGKVLIFNRTGADVKPDDIEAYHRLYSIKKAIVKFSKRKSIGFASLKRPEKH